MATYRRPSSYDFQICAQEVAELLRERFTGWLYSVDADGPVLGVTCKNSALDRDKTTPHAQIEEAIRKNKDTMGIVRVSDGSTDPSAIVQFFTKLYNGGHGIFKGSQGAELLIPVTVPVRDTTDPTGVRLCEVSSFVSKTTEYFIVQEDLMGRISARVSGYSTYSQKHAPANSLIQIVLRSEADKSRFLRELKNPTAVEYLLTRFRKCGPALLNGIMCSAVYFTLFGDAGTGFKDPMARTVAVEAYDRAVANILYAA